MLDTMTPGKDIEDVEIMKHRFEGFDKEMNANASRVAVVNQLARQLLHVEHPNSDEILERQNHLNQEWSTLREKAEAKMDDLKSAHGVQTFYIECRETISWIEDKKRILTETDSLEMDLTGVMTLQRRLSGMDRDLAAIQAKLSSLEREANSIEDEHPEEAKIIRERIAQIELIWEQLTQMLKERDSKLEEAGDLHRFLRDLDHFQTWLTKTQTDVASEDTPTSLPEAEKLLNQHQSIREEIDNYTEDYKNLMEKDHFDADKIGKRAENITGRREDNRQRALDQHEKLKNQVKLHEFLQDLEELAEWVQEKYATSQDESYRSAKTIHSKWTRHQAFEAEIAANKERLFEAEKSAQELSKEKPEFKDVIEPKLKELAKQFDDLEVHTKEKGAMLFDANREVLVQQTCDDIDSYITDLEKQIVSGDTANDLTSVNILMQKQQVIQTQMAVKARQVEEIDKQTEYLQKTVPEEKIEPIVVKKTAVLERFEKIKAPLLERQKALEKKKEAFQFCRDVEDEKLWIDEKLPVANSPDYGNSLFNVHVLKKKNQSLATEIDNHEPRINAICNNGRKLIDEGHEDAKKFEALISDLTQKWQELKDAIENRRKHLLESEKVQQYFFDAQEAESWMSEQELYMMVEDRGKDEISAQNLMKKHENLEQSVEDYANTIRQLGEVARQFSGDDISSGDAVAVKQSQLDKLYAGLKDLAGERRARLNEALQLFMLSREVDDLEQWITDREVVAAWSNGSRRRPRCWIR